MGLMTLKYRESRILATSMKEAYWFCAINSFLTYTRGPYQKAIAVIRDTIDSVKHITKFAGLSTIVGKHRKQHKNIRPDRNRLTAA